MFIVLNIYWVSAGGAGLTTYRELCSLANDLGQPDLIYRFMDLARASSALSAKRGAAVGVARIARLAATATGGEQVTWNATVSHYFRLSMDVLLCQSSTFAVTMYRVFACCVTTWKCTRCSNLLDGHLFLVRTVSAVMPTFHLQGGLSSLLGPERLAALLPKLYRLTHDPSPKVNLMTGCKIKPQGCCCHTDAHAQAHACCGTLLEVCWYVSSCMPCLWAAVEHIIQQSTAASRMRDGLHQSSVDLILCKNT